MLVVVVDDYLDVGMMTVGMLRREDYVTHLISENFDEWCDLAKWQELKPDVVVMDLGLPGIRGEDLLQVLQPMRETTRLVCVSAYSDTRLKDVEPLVDAVITKPFTRQALIDAVEGK